MATRTADHQAGTEGHQEAATLQAAAILQAEATLQVVASRPVDTEVVQDISKSQSDTKDPKASTLTRNCCTKSRKFCSNKRTNTEAAMEVVTRPVGTPAARESQANMEPQPFPASTAHPATARDALSESNSDMFRLVTKSPNS